MNKKYLTYLTIFFLCGLIIGLYAGQQMSRGVASDMTYTAASSSDLETFYTKTLNITAEQKKQLMEVDKAYKGKRDIYALRMHNANLKLADVIEREGFDSSNIKPLVQEIHKAMGDLQAQSLAHLSAIAAVLNKEQAVLLKQNVVERLRQN